MKRLLPFLVPLLAVLIVDQLTKRWALAALWPTNRNIDALGGLLLLTPVENRGVAFGLFGGLGIWLAVAVAGLLIFFAVRYWRQLLASPAGVKLAVGLIAGGGVGNLIDRARYGFVVDFIHIPWLPIFQVFNIADLGISVGGVAAVLLSILAELREARGTSHETGANTRTLE